MLNSPTIRNVSDSSTGRASGEKDVDLDAAFSVSTQDSSSLDFEFEFANGVGGDLYLNFVFASEEYSESIGRAFADAVAVFLDEDADGINLRNLAVTPSPPSPVSIDTINASLNPELYRNNAFGSSGSLVDKFGYDGFTVRMQATAKGLGPGPHRLEDCHWRRRGRGWRQRDLRGSQERGGYAVRPAAARASRASASKASGIRTCSGPRAWCSCRRTPFPTPRTSASWRTPDCGNGDGQMANTSTGIDPLVRRRS